MVQKIIKLKKKTARFFFFAGLAGIIIPHIAFLANLIPTLDVVSHPVFILISSLVTYIGYINK